jgi:hypothetical protein
MKREHILNVAKEPDRLYLALSTPFRLVLDGYLDREILRSD